MGSIPTIPTNIKLLQKNIIKSHLAYIIGVALGDGNLSNPNKRAVRLRITCDTKYQGIIKNIIKSLKIILPKNKISIVKRKGNCLDISCYSNKLESLLGWKVGLGSKYKQKVFVPKWIKTNKKFTLLCLKGLFETDGSIYLDRKYKMANFITVIPTLADDVMIMVKKIGFKPNIQFLHYNYKKTKITIRVSKNVENFINLTKIKKI
ncbi:MAG: LAGLIDADG family homing endonuclease [Patescibacteria group bacterium]